MNSKPTSRRPQCVKDLLKEVSKADPDPEICKATLLSLLLHQESHGSSQQLTEDHLAPLRTACQKSFRRQRRKAELGSQRRQQWDDLLQLLLGKVGSVDPPPRTPADAVDRKEEDTLHNCNKASEQLPGLLPLTVSQYLGRLTKHHKDLYKNPPVLPPLAIVVLATRAPVPTRDLTTGRLSFRGTDRATDTDPIVMAQFHPNTTPTEILRGGAFGGTYFRPIHSAVTNAHYQSGPVLEDTVDPDWIAGLDQQKYLINSEYDASVNKFGVKCGGSLGMWESSGWISDADPYGWFQWFCRFYQGRRSSDDARQIKRWLGVAGPKGRFKSQLCNKIVAAGGVGRIDDSSISPVIRQSLYHWGLRITSEVLEQHTKR